MDMQIDESLYSRQLYVIGKDAMEKMMKSKVLVIGLDGLGQEVVKNLCLTGVSQIYIHDPSDIREENFSSSFYFKKLDLGKKKDEVLLDRFKLINEYVSVNILEDISSFLNIDLVITCNEQVHSMIKLNKQARRDNTKFIGCQSRGVFSQIFCDFGTDFICVDTNGEAPVTGMINDISSTGVLTVVKEQRHNLEDGDFIKIIPNDKYHKVGKDYEVCIDYEVGKKYEGILFKIKGLSNAQVQLTKIDGSSILESEFSNIKELPFNFSEIYGGDFEQIKRPKIFNFKMLEDSLTNPTVQFSSSDITHNCFLALSEYTEKFHCLPNEDQFVSFYIKKYNSQDSLLKYFGRQCNASFMPVCSIVGGFVAQEALKGISYKFTPLFQFMYYDAQELCVDFPFSKKNFGRYNSLYKIFGEEALKKLFNMKIFLVGAGAIGCEHLKNLVMTGISSLGSLNITDMDSIEQSNLNRQFLYSKEDIGKMKAEVIASKISSLNHDYKSIPSYYNLKVGEETEEVFSDVFFSDLDFVLNALDNVEARIYIDSRCVLHKIPLVDAGTSGTKGNVQVVVPFFSESYGSSRDPPEKQILTCTIKNFPYAIEHTIKWAMSEFDLKFYDEIIKLKKNKQKEELSELKRLSPQCIEDCIRLGLRLFIKYFHTSIQELIKSYPPDTLTKEEQPFWMPPKRIPEPINLDINNDLHVTFIRSAANIYSDVYFIGSKIDNIFVKNFINHELENIDEVYDKEEQKEIDYKLLIPIEFEKDNDLNNHVDFVHSCANLRAQNYKIKNVDRLTSKGIAGKIIPAIATTTAVISGLSIIEMIKVFLKLGQYRNSFLNLALPFFGYSDLIEAKKKYYLLDKKKYYFTSWNRLEYKNTLLKNIIKAFEIQFKTQVSMLTIDNKLLYSNIDSKFDHNLNKQVSEFVDIKKGLKYIVVDLITESKIDEYPKIVVLVDK